MTDLTEKWKSGEIEALDDLINQIETVDDNYSLNDEYLQEKGLIIREEFGPAGEYPYGIVIVISDYVLPYLKKLQVLKEENQQFKELMKECKPYIIRNVVFTTINRAEVVDLEKNELLTKINNAIGEK